jgi:hypothetical protein
VFVTYFEENTKRGKDDGKNDLANIAVKKVSFWYCVEGASDSDARL